MNQLLRAKYGDLLGFQMSSKRIVLMSNLDQMIELFKQDDALGRGDTSPCNVLRPGGEGRKDNSFPG